MAMTSRERVLTALDQRQPDRVPVNYIGTPEIDAALTAHFGAHTMDPVLDILDIDLRGVAPRYVGPKLRTWPDGRFENIWGHIRKPIQNIAGRYDESVEFPYAAFETLEDVENWRWPVTDWHDYSHMKADCDTHAGRAVFVGRPGNMDMINGISFGRGVEQVIFDIALESEVYLACAHKRLEFCHADSEQMLRACDGRADILWIGDDYGTQNSLLMSPDKWRRLFKPSLARMCALGHKYGVKVMLHSCGSTHPIWEDFIEVGVDIVDTVQPEAAGMDPAELKKRFGGRISMHGTMSTQKTLPFGSPADVAAEARLRVETAGRDGGLILAPAHNIQPDTPVPNILAMYEAAGAYRR